MEQTALTFLLVAVGILAGRTLAHRAWGPEWLAKMFKYKPWKAGITVALLNAAILALTLLIAYIPISLTPDSLSLIISIPLMFVLSFLAPMVSVFVWLTCKYTIGVSIRDRLVVSLVGQSIYAVLFLYLLYKTVTFEPAFQGQDVVMKTVGYGFATAVCLGSFFVGIIAICTSLPKMKEEY